MFMQGNLSRIAANVLTHRHSQVVYLPEEMRFPSRVKKVQVRAQGMDRIISPVGHTWDAFFLSGPRVSDDFMTDRAPNEPSGGNSLR
jgi:antitoxin VapB